MLLALDVGSDFVDVAISHLRGSHKADLIQPPWAHGFMRFHRMENNGPDQGLIVIANISEELLAGHFTVLRCL